MNANMKLLRAKLTDFGLNPADWILETESRIGPIFEFALRRHADTDSDTDGALILQGWAMQETWLTLSIQG